MTRSWTAPDLKPAELDALRQILEGEYRPTSWADLLPVRATKDREEKKAKHETIPLFDRKP